LKDGQKKEKHEKEVACSLFSRKKQSWLFFRRGEHEHQLHQGTSQHEQRIPQYRFPSAREH
jgi:hypothetical protein